MTFFTPIILGTDQNVYGVASSVYQYYEKKSIAFGIKRQAYTENLSYLDVHVHENFDQLDTFVRVLMEYGKVNTHRKLILIPCSEYYAEMLIKAQDLLKKYYLFNVIDKEFYTNLEDKMSFYHLCDKYSLPYPNTEIVNKNNYAGFQYSGEYPIILKPSDSQKWLHNKFEGYKKAFKIHTPDELTNILERIYQNGYDSEMIIQDFIPGEVDTMFVVNAYVSKDGRVLMTHGAQTALNEVLPYEIGNYNALISGGGYSELTELVRQFLEKIPYHGFANFDFKYDERDKQFKVFEMNLRQGRSSMYMTYAGNNFMTYLIDDLLFDYQGDYYNHNKSHLWYSTSRYVLNKYAPERIKPKINELFKQGKYNFSLDYAADENLKRRWLRLKRKLSTIRYFSTYAENLKS